MAANVSITVTGLVHQFIVTTGYGGIETAALGEGTLICAGADDREMVVGERAEIIVEERAEIIVPARRPSGEC